MSWLGVKTNLCVCVMELFTMVAVKGMLSMREEAKAETHMTRMMAMASRSASGTA